MAQGIGQVRFSDSHRTADDDILVIADKGEIEEVPDPLPVQRDRDVPFEPLDRLVGVERPLPYPPLDGSLIPPLDLVAQDELQKILVGELLSSRVGDPLYEGEEDAREAEPPEHLFQFSPDFHSSSFMVGGLPWSPVSALNGDGKDACP